MKAKVDYKKFKAFSKKIQRTLYNKDVLSIQNFIEDCSKELAARLLSRVIKRTPVGHYPNTKKSGGALRRGWTGGKDTPGTTYAKSLPVSKQGSDFVVTVTNGIYYASYVEFGHRRKPGQYIPELGKCTTAGWTDGLFMLTISESEVESIMPALLEKRLNEYLTKIFEGGDK